MDPLQSFPKSLRTDAQWIRRNTDRIEAVERGYCPDCQHDLCKHCHKCKFARCGSWGVLHCMGHGLPGFFIRLFN